MPLYEYCCPRCGATRDVRVALDELKTIMVICHGPKCDAHMRRVIPKINIIFKWKEKGENNG